jgi:hypothetical protein
MDYNIWFWTYLKSLFIMANTYNPTDDYTRSAMKCFISCISDILPDKYLGDSMKDFLNMKSQVQSLILNNIHFEQFLNTFSDYKTIIKNTPSKLFDLCLLSSESLFSYIYLLNIYFIILFNKSGYLLNIPTFNEIKSMYNPSNIKKEDWGNSLWFIIHMTPLYAPGSTIEVFNNLKAFLSCLRFILPCPKCRLHLSENLPKINIDNCAMTKDSIFECTWRLHNIVNKDLNKYEPSLREAFGYYIFK